MGRRPQNGLLQIKDLPTVFMDRDHPFVFYGQKNLQWSYMDKITPNCPLCERTYHRGSPDKRFFTQLLWIKYLQTVSYERKISQRVSMDKIFLNGLMPDSQGSSRIDDVLGVLYGMNISQRYSTLKRYILVIEYLSTERSPPTDLPTVSYGQKSSQRYSQDTVGIVDLLQSVHNLRWIKYTLLWKNGYDTCLHGISKHDLRIVNLFQNFLVINLSILFMHFKVER